ncbi:uncharacterized protein LOC144706414 isoform X2 [Wolffia australiana]
MEEWKDLESFALIDVFSEDDLLLASPRGVAKSGGLVESSEEYLRFSFQSSSEIVKISSPISNKCSTQVDPTPIPSESPEPNKHGERYNLRKSLAWDKAFFTSAGVLDPEELADVNNTFRNTKKQSLPEIPEDERKSSDSLGESRSARSSPAKLPAEPNITPPSPSEEDSKAQLLLKVETALLRPPKACPRIPKLPPNRKPLVSAQSTLQTGQKKNEPHPAPKSQHSSKADPEIRGKIPKLPLVRRPLVKAKSTLQTREKSEPHTGGLSINRSSKDTCQPMRSSSSISSAGKPANSASSSQLAATSARTIPKQIKSSSSLRLPSPKIGYFDAEQSRHTTSSKPGREQ